MSDKRIDGPPSETKSDAVHTLVKASIASIPLVGGAAAEFFSALITPPINKRRDAWLNSIAEDLKELEKEVDQFKIETLSQNERFISTFLSATQKASRTHVNAKLEALRNAVLNSALDKESEEDFLESLFLDMIEEISSLHIRLLRFFEKYPSIVIYYIKKIGKYDFESYEDVRKEYESELKNLFSSENELIGKLTLNLLTSRDLAKIDDDHSYDWKDLPSHVSLTELGRRFLQYITTPLQVSSGPALHVDEGQKIIRKYEGRKVFQQFSYLIHEWYNNRNSYTYYSHELQRFLYRSAIPVYLYITKFSSTDVELEVYDNSYGWNDDKLVATISHKDGASQQIILLYTGENSNIAEVVTRIIKELKPYLEWPYAGPKPVVLILLPYETVTNKKPFFDEIRINIAKKLEGNSNLKRNIALILPCDDLENLIEML